MKHWLFLLAASAEGPQAAPYAYSQQPIVLQHPTHQAMPPQAKLVVPQPYVVQAQQPVVQQPGVQPQILVPQVPVHHQQPAQIQQPVMAQQPVIQQQHQAVPQHQVIHQQQPQVVVSPPQLQQQHHVVPQPPQVVPQQQVVAPQVVPQNQAIPPQQQQRAVPQQQQQVPHMVAQQVVPQHHIAHQVIPAQQQPMVPQGAHQQAAAPPPVALGKGFGSAVEAGRAQQANAMPPAGAAYNAKVVSVREGAAVPSKSGPAVDESTRETIASEWDKEMKNFMPQMILTFRLNAGEAEHFHQDVASVGTLIRGGFFESTAEGSGSAGSSSAGRRHAGFKILSPSGKLVHSSDKAEGLFRLACEETGTYTFAVSAASWSKAKFVTFVMGTGEVSALSSSDITSIDGNIQMLYRMLSEIETHNNLLWARHRAQADQIRRTSNKTYYAFVVELLCTAGAVAAQLTTVKKMIAKRSMF